MKKLLQENDFILKEGAVGERIRRAKDVRPHPMLAHAPLIYDPVGRKALSDIYNGYIQITKEADLPFLMSTPTRKANQERVLESGIQKEINIDAAHFMKSIRAAYPDFHNNIKIGGIIGCKNDCYTPEEGLSVPDSESFHAWQIEELIKGGVDFIFAETMPNVNEALGMAKYLGETEKPYIISFVISSDGLILDGTTLTDAINKIDNAVTNAPIGYAVNCAFPTFLQASNQPQELFKRLVGFSGNGSALDHCDLEGSAELKSEPVKDWGEEMLALNRSFGVKILGGCCGTEEQHLRYLIAN